MTEYELSSLGFNKKNSMIGEYPPYYYYSKDFTDGFSLISDTNDVVIDNNWYVEVFNTDLPIRYDVYVDVKTLIELIEKGIKNV